MDKTKNNISMKDCFDMAIKIGDKIENSWRHYYLILLAIAAWSFSSSGLVLAKSHFPKYSILFIVFIFSIYNCVFIGRMYKLFEILLNELHERATQDSFIVDGNLKKFVELNLKGKYGKAGIVAAAVHFICYVSLFFILMGIDIK